MAARTSYRNPATIVHRVDASASTVTACVRSGPRSPADSVAQSLAIRAATADSETTSDVVSFAARRPVPVRNPTGCQ
jgi:hypothetical protein